MNDRSYENSSETPDKNDISNALGDDAARRNETTEAANSMEDGVTVVPEEEYDRMTAPNPDAPEDISDRSRKKRTRKDKKGVPFIAFVSSLLAVLLVCGMFTVAIASATRRYGYLEGVHDALGMGEDNDPPGSIFDDMFGSGEFAELEFLDQFFKAFSYYDLEDADLLTAVLKAYVEATGDLHAEYYTQEEYEAMRAENAGEGVGIGVSVIYSKIEIEGVEYAALEIITAYPDSPAADAGVLPGDLIYFIGSGEEIELVQDLGFTQSVNRLRGKEGTNAKFTVLRPKDDGTYEERSFDIVREKYTTRSVEYKVSETDPTVGIVRILQFGLETPAQFTEAMDTLIQQGIKRFVFDVRNNPGGDLKSISAILSYFLEEGDLILSTVDRAGAKEEFFANPVTYDDEYEGCSILKSDIGKYRGYEMTVLSNGNTASAAELFTAAMRDYELATIVGTTTYGKGSMQFTYLLSYWGFEGAIKLTTRHYFPPCGESYHEIGIAPDIEVELSEEAASVNLYKLAEADDNQLQAALSALGKN